MRNPWITRFPAAPRICTTTICHKPCMPFSARPGRRGTGDASECQHSLTRPGCQRSLTLMTDADVLADATGSKDPAVGLRAVSALKRLHERLEAVHVDNARAQGWSWQAIADALGVSRQAVHQKYQRRR